MEQKIYIPLFSIANHMIVNVVESNVILRDDYMISTAEYYFKVDIPGMENADPRFCDFQFITQRDAITGIDFSFDSNNEVYKCYITSIGSKEAMWYFQDKDEMLEFRDKVFSWRFIDRIIAKNSN